MGDMVKCDWCGAESYKQASAYAPKGWLYAEIVDQDEPGNTMIAIVCSEDCSRSIWRKGPGRLPGGPPPPRPGDSPVVKEPEPAHAGNRSTLGDAEDKIQKLIAAVRDLPEAKGLDYLLVARVRNANFRVAVSLTQGIAVSLAGGPLRDGLVGRELATEYLALQDSQTKEEGAV